MMTAHNEKQLTQKTLKEGASYFLHKPLTVTT
jgi:FixJ family two-component response regulator